MKLTKNITKRNEVQFSRGSFVRVKSREKILQNLDALNKRNGCLFMDQMWECCGKEFKVLKIINNYFDEYQYKMYKTKSSLYLLEGLICNGTSETLNGHCDRSCYLLWHGDWLENTDGKNKHDDEEIKIASLPESEQICSDLYPKDQFFCQLTNIHEIVKKNSVLNEFFQYTANIISSIKTRIVIILRKISGSTLAADAMADRKKGSQAELQVGDFVKIKSASEIKKFLDKQGKYKGCGFAREMYVHCDKTYKVLKPVSYFYDEAKQKISKAKSIVILENVNCNGSFRLYPMRCDRMCFYFWRTEWLEKIEGTTT